MQTHATVPLSARRKLAFAYDSMGRRIRKSVWHGTSSGGWQLRHHFDFIHELNGWNILAERSGGSTNSFIRTYTWGTDLSGTLSGAGGVGGLLFTTLHTSNKTFAYGNDLNGNVTLLVDTATGQPAATYDYGPFGEPLRQSGGYALLNPYRFSTKYTDDETGWLDYGLRYYIPATGRWPSRDPIEEEGGINLYGFVGNQSTVKVDALGRRAVGPGRFKVKPWPTGINPEIYETHKWHHTRQEVGVVYCKCTEQETGQFLKEALKNFTFFNEGNRHADILIDGNSAGFDLHGFGGFMSDLINSNRAGVALTGSGPGFDQEAKTNILHPLIGMRRWGHNSTGDVRSGLLGPGWKGVIIWTEAYETTNNMNWLAANYGWAQAIDMWNEYITRVADKLTDKCGGYISPQAKVVKEEKTAKIKLPWL
jgi:RHS repeat-associated protein